MGWARRHGERLLGETVENIDQFAQLFSLFDFTLRHSVGDAVVDVVSEDGKANPVQSRLGGSQLLQNVDAQARFLDHAPNAPDLTLDTIEARNKRLLLSGS